MKVINLSMHSQFSWGSKLGVIVIAFVCSTAAAYTLWRWVERPAQKLSAAVRYRRRVEVALE